MKKNDYSVLNEGELLDKRKSLKEELFKLNQQRFGGRVEKPHMFSLIRKDIARINTMLGKKGKK
ncbi:MAG: 50S ribosomal protein L29 [Candidatus Omnitrophica bacterium]|nr:50S ribosomal protein L29 [Candidatus Omnitrophota bacterium]